MVRRISSGVPGLDKLIKGGFVHNSVNLISGQTGTGKSLLGCQFLWYGLQKGETGVFVSLEEDPEDIRAQAILFGWDFKKFEDKGLCKIIYHDPAQVDTVSSVLIDELSDLNAKRLVIDSVSVLGLTLESVVKVRRKIFGIISAIKKNTDCTTLIISEVPEGTKALSRYGVEEFVADSVIVLGATSVGKSGFERTLQIIKMRQTDHDESVHSIDFGKKGIRITD